MTPVMITAETTAIDLFELGVFDMMSVHSPDSMAPRTLIADDQPDVLEALRLLLKGEGYQTETVTSPAAVLEAVGARDYDVLLMDLNYARDTTSGQEGLDLLTRVRALDSTLPIVVMTAWGSIELAVEAMRRGVGDFVQKPWENTQLLKTLRQQVALGRTRRRGRRLAAEQDQEFEESREIQQGLLPKEIPQVRGYEIAALWRPARAVSGDYYDVVKFGETRAGVCIADVSGKGMPAALLMSNLQAAVKAFASEATSAKELCEKINRVMCSNTAAGKFITFFYCLLEAETRRLVYTNAGHNAPILVRRDGTLVRLEAGGAVLGAFPNWSYEQAEVMLGAGDRVLLFTDGLSEVRNSAGEEFGEERLVSLLVEHRGLSVAELQKRVMGEVSDFSAGNFQDDATLIVMSVE